MEGSGECSMCWLSLCISGTIQPWRGNCVQRIFLWSREWRAARGGVYNCAGAFGGCHVPCSYDESAARVPSAVSVLVPVKPPVFVGVEKAQLTVSERPRGFGHVCKQLSLAVLLRRVSDICACLCQAGISPHVLGKHRSCPWLFGSHCSLKLFFFI